MWDEELFFYWLRSQVKAAGTGPSIAHPNKFCFLEENTMKKHDMMKKFTAAALSLTMMAGLAACSGGSSSASSGENRPVPAKKARLLRRRPCPGRFRLRDRRHRHQGGGSEADGPCLPG